MRNLRFAVLFLLTAGSVLNEPARAAEAVDETASTCRQETPQRFMLRGAIDRRLADCVQATLQPSTTTVVVDSEGGNVDAALDIAERLAPLAVELRVQRLCASSCANYFLPLARRVVVEPGAVVIVHGSIDPRLVHRTYDMPDARAGAMRTLLDTMPGASEEALDAAFADARASLVATATRQNAFMRRYRISPGWLLYRDAGDDGFGAFLQGEPRALRRWAWRVVVHYIAVEEPMLRSCLPGVEVVPFQAALEASVKHDKQQWRAFAKAGGVRSGSLRCTADPLPTAVTAEGGAVPENP